jgi:hypothetical protein
MQQSKTATSKINFLHQFKSWLHDPESHQKEIAIRLQLRGESWMENSSTVLIFSSHAIISSHLPARAVNNITDLNNVPGFKIDEPYKIFMPDERYHIGPFPEYLKISYNGLQYG